MRYGFASLRAVFVLPLFLVTACATAQPLPSRAAFSEQVLEPLADKRAGEIIEQNKANATLATAQFKKDHPHSGSVSGLLTAIGGLLGHVPGAAIGGALGAALDAAPKDDPDAALAVTLAWMDTRRAPVKAKILALYEGHLQTTDDYFAVCSQGKERRYARRSSFPRLDDGPGPCPLIPIALADDVATTGQGK